MKPLRPLCVSAAWMLAAAAGAQDFSAGGFVDLRLSSSTRQLPSMQGGEGKTRFGGGTQAQLADVDLWGTAQITEDMLAYADIQYQPDQRNAVDLQQAYLRFRPLSLTPWRWSIKVGAFFRRFRSKIPGPAGAVRGR